MRQAKHYFTQGDRLQCKLCPHNCLIEPEREGVCRTRVNHDGVLYVANYGASTALSLDPIEKKPLYHFYPGADILSIGSWGCNFTCRFCQNWHIAQQKAKSTNLTPDDVVQLVLSSGGNNIGIAYTYSEPGVWFEFVYDTAIAVKNSGMMNVVVTNGYLNRQPLAELLKVTDAMNIDVKAFTEQFYHAVCSGSLNDVKNTVELAVQSCHIEITTLIIPGLNDSEIEIEALAKWLATLSPDIPLHLTRYFPSYQMDIPPTPIETIQKVWDIAREHLNYVYIGNAGNDRTSTLCPQCGITLLNRNGRINRLVRNTCPECGQPIVIVGKIFF